MRRPWLAIVLLGSAVLGLGGFLASRREPAAYQPEEVPAEYRDLGVACFVLGEEAPPIDELDDRELESIVAVLARLTHAYERASFDSFLALRVGDFEFAEREHASRLEELRRLCSELGVPESEVPEDWIGAIEVFWRTYYARPPVDRFVPEASRVELHRDELPGAAPEDWARSFEEICNRTPGATIWHRLMIPHRNGIVEIASPGGRLTWMDFDLRFESMDAPPGRLLTRFVWDGTAEEWFLERAATVYEDDVQSDGRCLVL